MQWDCLQQRVTKVRQGPGPHCNTRASEHNSTFGDGIAAGLTGEAASEDTPSWLPSSMADAPMPECCEAPGELWPCSAASAWSARSAPAD